MPTATAAAMAQASLPFFPYEYALHVKGALLFLSHYYRGVYQYFNLPIRRRMNGYTHPHVAHTHSGSVQRVERAFSLPTDS